MIFKTTLAAAIVAIGSLAAVAPASAGSNLTIAVDFDKHGCRDRCGGGQHWGGGQHKYRTLSPSQVRQILKWRGFNDIRYVDKEGDVYRVRADNYKNGRVIVRINARSGAIINVRRV